MLGTITSATCCFVPGHKACVIRAIGDDGALEHTIKIVALVVERCVTPSAVRDGVEPHRASCTFDAVPRIAAVTAARAICKAFDVCGVVVAIGSHGAVLHTVLVADVTRRTLVAIRSLKGRRA